MSAGYRLRPSTQLSSRPDTARPTVVQKVASCFSGPSAVSASRHLDAVAGIEISGNGNALTIEGNFIGTNLAGTASLEGSSGQAAVFFNSPNPWTGSVTMGGRRPGQRRRRDAHGRPEQHAEHHVHDRGLFESTGKFRALPALPAGTIITATATDPRATPRRCRMRSAWPPLQT